MFSILATITMPSAMLDNLEWCIARACRLAYRVSKRRCMRTSRRSVWGDGRAERRDFGAKQDGMAGALTLRHLQVASDDVFLRLVQCRNEECPVYSSCARVYVQLHQTYLSGKHIHLKV